VRITRTDITAAGLAITRARGLDAVSIVAVAKEMGVSSRALYHHVTGIDELRWMVIDRVLAELPEFDGALEPALWFTQYAKTTREVLLLHPGVADHILRFGAFSEAVFHAVDQCLDCFVAVGLEPELAARCAAMVLSWLASFVTREHAYSSAPLQSVPASARTRASLSEVTFDDLFAFELDRMLAATIGYDGR
jgi:TetR/AcrR family transcriptional regulator, tetracycline repressor protein